MSVIDTERVTLISPSAHPSCWVEPRDVLCVCVVVTQAALVLTVRLQQSLMSSSEFYLVAGTFDPAEHTSMF